MTSKTKAITKTRVLAALEASNAISMAALYRELSGGKSDVPSSSAKKIRELVPDIAERLAANKAVGGKPRSGPKTQKKKPARKKYARSKKNPYREGSGYALIFDILAAHPRGIRRDKLVEIYASVSGKDPAKGAKWDCSVILSPKGTSPTSERHRSAQEGYGLEKEADWVRLRT